MEPVFVHVCYHRGPNRFTMRGRVKVDIQWRSFTLVHNLGEIVRFSPRLA